MPERTVSLPGPLGLLGGTFDPIHFGHLRLAETARDRLGLGQVCLIPAGFPPHRVQPAASPEHRLAMTRLAVADNPALLVDDAEVRMQVPSYTVHTLQRLRTLYGSQCPLVLILGMDAFLGLPGWHQWESLFSLAHIAVVNRPQLVTGANPVETVPALAAFCAGRWCDQPAMLAESPAGHVIFFDMTAVATSASMLRSLFQTGISTRYLLPDSVLDYIVLHHLYH